MAANLSPEDERALGELARRGEKIEAIKLYRERTGAGLAEAKEAIENLGSPRPAPASSPPLAQPSRPPIERTTILHALQRHGKIQAIQEYRRQTGCDLRDAKLAVDQIVREEGITPPRSGCLGMILLAAAGVISVVLIAFWR